MIPASEPMLNASNDVMKQPVDPFELQRLHQEVADRERELALARRQLEAFARDIRNTQQANRRHRRELRTLQHDTVLRLMRAAKFRDSETGTHLHRISRLSGVLAHRLGLPLQQVRLIEAAAALHDLGKIGIEDSILHKAAPLDPREWEIMKRHTTIGAELLQGSSSPLLELGCQIALSHHERWDGSGYPHGRAGEAIPLAARIVMLADQYDALRSNRRYKPSYDHETACRILLHGDGRTRPEHFDPELLALFGEIQQQVKAIWRALRICEEAPDLSVLLCAPQSYPLSLAAVEN